MNVSHYTVAGKILASKASGARIDLAHGADGSVAMIASSAAAVLQTYRYKPSGATLQVSGTPTSNLFLWAGSRGFRTSNSTALVYLKSGFSRTTSSNLVTPPLARLNRYAYRPWAINQGPTISCRNFGGTPAAYQCGGYAWIADWVVSGPPPIDGYIVQEVVVVSSYKDCKTNNPLPPAYPCDPSPVISFGVWIETYWEAFKVDATTQGGLDSFNAAETPKCSYGKRAHYGYAKFVDNETFQQWKRSRFLIEGGAPCAGKELPSGTQMPTGWNRIGAHRKEITIDHACCCNPRKCPGENTDCAPGDCRKTTFKGGKCP